MVKYTRCSVYGCGVRNLQFFHFPRNVQRAEKWRELAGNPALYAIPLDKLHHKASVCKRHFTRDQFTNTKLDRLNLNAFPSLHLPPPGNPDLAIRTTPPTEDTTVSPPVPNNPAPLPAPVLHYVVFPSVDTISPTPTTIELSPRGDGSEDKACHVHAESPSPPVLSVPETVPPVAFQCGTAVQDEVPPSFAVLTEYCDEPETVVGGLKEECEVGEDVPIDGHYKYTLCRLCFSTLDIITTDIFSVDKGCGYVIKDVIEDLLQFKVSKMDEYPQFICISCLNKLTEFREFKEKILKDKAVFEEALRKLKSSAAEEEGLAEEVDGVDASQHAEICPTDFVQLISFDASGESINVGIPDHGTAEQVFSEADRLTASVEEPVISPELVIRRELNTGLVMVGEGSRCLEGSRWFEYRNHLVKRKNKGKVRSRLLSECPLCGKRFKKQEDLDKHCATHANLSTQECARCGVVLKVAMPQNGKPRAAPIKALLCATCRKAFGEGVPGQLNHVPSGIKLCGEGGSGREFNVDILVMKDSRSSHHRGKKPFSCRQCGKSFPMTEILERHMKLSHLSKKRFRCEYCNERFALKRCLHDHVKLHARGMS